MSAPVNATALTGKALAAAFAERDATGGYRRPWLRERRAAAAAAFAERGLPNERRNEERFRFLNLKPLLAESFNLTPDGDAADASLLARHSLSDAGVQLVFVDGLFRPGLSRLAPGIAAGSLAGDLPPAIQDALAAVATRYNENPFLAINAMFFRDGAWLHLPAGRKLATPISLVYLASGQSGGAMLCPRLLVLADDGSQATLVEQFLGADAPYFTNAASEIVLGQDAELTHYRLQIEGPAAKHIAASEVVLAKPGTRYNNMCVNLGAALARHEINAVLNASQVEATLNGINLLGGEQVSDTHSRIEHLQPNSRSNELYKGVLAEHSRAVFNGRIFVHQRAQKTNAFQSNPNVLLSDDAVANSNPELEIYADDVRCTHGATCGDLDQNALFYLRQRGLGHERAVDLLIYAFLAELLEPINVPILREHLQKQIDAKLATARRLPLAA